MKVGNKVVFKQDWDIFPHTIIKKGRTGIINEIDEYVWVLLDTPEPELVGWDNKVQLGDDERKIEDYLEVRE